MDSSPIKTGKGFEKNIIGIKINKRSIKLSMLADDLTLILTDLVSVENALKLLNKYTQCSGRKINIGKTKAKHHGCSNTSDYYSHGLSWIKTPLETLGVHITNNEEENLKYKFKPEIATLKNLLNIWKQRTLTIKGKITIVNTFALSPLICLQFNRNSPRGNKRNKRYNSKFHMGKKNSKNCPKH